jgi:hypothetical protein
VLEKYADCFRDFRGGTIHASTLQMMDELGWLGAFLALRHAYGQARAWAYLGIDVRVCVNVSTVQFARPDVVDLVATVLVDSNLPAERLELELTETEHEAVQRPNADRRATVPLAGARHDDVVAVRENVRCSPSGSANGVDPPALCSKKGSGGVRPASRKRPVPSRSPARRLQPVDRTMGDHLRDRPIRLGQIGTRQQGALVAFAHRPRRECDAEGNSRALARPESGSRRYGSGVGSASGRMRGTRYGASASRVTSHGETDVPKFLPRNGPSESRRSGRARRRARSA